MVRHSGLQLQVLSLFKAALRVAKQKDVAQGNKTHYTRGINYQFVRERFRDDVSCRRVGDFCINELS